MKVKNYIVENKKLFFDCIEKELCQKGISYVKVDSEIHFQNQIVRLYDIELDKTEIISFLLSRMNLEKKEINAIINKFKYSKNLFIETEEALTTNDKNYQKMNKTTQKQQSNQVNQKIKTYKK